MKHLHLLAFLLPFVLFLSSCGDDDEGSTEPPRGENSIAQIVDGTEGLTVIKSLLASPNFSTLRNQLASGEYTLLAPNDAAFQKLLATLNVSNINLIDIGVLSDILDYHIIPNQTLQIGQLDSSEVTLSQQTLTFSERDSVQINASVAAQSQTTIVSPEPLYASNGVVHVINEVLLPPSLQAIASEFGTVAGLLEVLDGVRLMNQIVDAAQLNQLLTSSAQSFTVIAPVDGFLFDNNFDTSENGVRFFGLNQIINGTINVTSPPRKASTLAGIPVYLSYEQVQNQQGQSIDVLYINGELALDFGITTGNGQVLFNNSGIIDPPTDVSGALGAIQEVTGQTFSIFQAALAQAELSLSGEKTIFAPTDSAFIRAGIVATVDSASRIDVGLLTSILNNHIVEGVSFSSDLASGSLSTLNETAITLNLSGSGSTISDANEESADARFVFLDEYVYFGNLADVEELTEVGVVHAIDQLLLPE